MQKLADDIFHEMNQGTFKPHTARFGASTDEEIQQIIDERGAKNTLKSVKCSMRILESYLKEKGMPTTDEIPTEQWPKLLEDFYANARTKDRKKYNVGSMKSIRSNINRWFQENKNINIITDKGFSKSNLLFKGVQVCAKKDGLGIRKSTVPISDADLMNIANYFNVDHMNSLNPRVLQKNVIFNLMYHTCRRGHENLYIMEKDWFKVVVTPTGEHYIEQARDELDKNHREDTTSIPNMGRIYENKGKFHNKKTLN